MAEVAGRAGSACGGASRGPCSHRTLDRKARATRGGTAAVPFRARRAACGAEQGVLCRRSPTVYAGCSAFVALVRARWAHDRRFVWVRTFVAAWAGLAGCAAPEPECATCTLGEDRISVCIGRCRGGNIVPWCRIPAESTSLARIHARWARRLGRRRAGRAGSTSLADSAACYGIGASRARSHHLGVTASCFAARETRWTRRAMACSAQGERAIGAFRFCVRSLRAREACRARSAARYCCSIA